MADSLNDLEDAIDAFIAERDWAQFHTPKNLTMAVAIEASELMEHFLWATGTESASPDPARKEMVAQEIGDVLIYLLRLARMLDIDVIAAARDKLVINRDKYPVEKAKGTAKKYLDLE
jgi:NTP pyrophosphatase (non-canonical NTP hydrolase)